LTTAFRLQYLVPELRMVPGFSGRRQLTLPPLFRSGDGTESGVSWSWQAPRSSFGPDHAPSAPIREATPPPPPVESPLPARQSGSPSLRQPDGKDLRPWTTSLPAAGGQLSRSECGEPTQPACITRTNRYAPGEGFLTEVTSSSRPPSPPTSELPSLPPPSPLLAGKVRPASPLTVVIAATPLDGLGGSIGRHRCCSRPTGMEEFSYTSLPRYRNMCSHRNGWKNRRLRTQVQEYIF
jgi:hypothetical protein